MNRNSLAKMRLDRRLLRRRGWIGAAELEASLAALPDVAAKATTLGDVDDEGDTGAPPGASGESPPVS